MTVRRTPRTAARALLAAALAGACSVPAAPPPGAPAAAAAAAAPAAVPAPLPDSTRFQQIVLVEGSLNEPTEIAVASDGRVFLTERRGALKLYEPATGAARVVARLPVFDESENGLIGITLDPAFDRTGWLYLTYSVADALKHRVSRFTFTGEGIEDEKILLEVPFTRGCCHTGGSMTFDGRGNLLVSFGDNTNPFDAGSYAPIDPTPGRELMDARRTSANTMDLRGKIVRITPRPDGGYDVPAGNLFRDSTVGRPEIYTMGHRNPYRISVDPATGFLYWGDVGPDARADSVLGPKGHDEVNQARRPGNFGWPLFIADNKPYLDYDFTSGRRGDYFDPAAPVNDSPNNTGARLLPPAQPAFIWYPYEATAEFPLVGEGGRSAMAGPVYRYDAYPGSTTRLPRHYDGKLLVYEWMRSWMRAVEMDRDGDYAGMEPFLDHLTLTRPMDVELGPDGSLYLLEYGTYWFSPNPDSKLSRIVYHTGNRPPAARVSLSRSSGAAPLTVELSARESFDHDAGDVLRHAWTIGEGPERTGETITHTFTEPGTHRVRLVTRDASGATSTAEAEVVVGNEPPRVGIELDGNRSFFWDEGPIGYRVHASDAEDGALGRGLDPARVRVTLEYLPEGLAGALAAGHQESATPRGLALIEASDCMGCHGVDRASVGPSFRMVAERYAATPDTTGYLVGKIIEGGGGVWGEHSMSAHPGLRRDVASEMVRYILSLATPGTPLPAAGELRLDRHPAAGTGAYVLGASYVDDVRNGVGPLRDVARVVLRAPVLRAGELGDSIQGDGGHLRLGRLDLTGVGGVVVGAASLGPAVRVELREGHADGRPLGSAELPAGRRATVRVPVAAAGVRDLYLVFRAAGGGGAAGGIVRLEEIRFERAR